MVPRPGDHAGGEGSRGEGNLRDPFDFMFKTDFVDTDPPRGISHTNCKICQPGGLRASVRAFLRSVRVTDGAVRAKFPGRSITGGRCVRNRWRCEGIFPSVRAQASQCGLFSERCALIYGRCEEITVGAGGNREARCSGRKRGVGIARRGGAFRRAGRKFCVDAARDIHIMRRRRAGAAQSASRGV
jgi:hypothetical protein